MQCSVEQMINLQPGLHSTHRSRAFIATFALATLISFITERSSAALEDLVQQDMRPTIADVLRETPGVLSLKPISVPDADPRLKVIPTDAPKMIAELEFAFPGAIWAPLGRDSAFLADVLEAYYISRGMPGRVVRLNASTPSFANGMTFEFLTTNGLKLDANGRPTRPFILIDATSWRGTVDSPVSQIRQLVASVYARVPRTEQVKLFSRINAIGQGPASGGVYNGEIILRTTNIEKFKASLQFGQGGPSRILYTTSAFQYGSKDWHASFQAFRKLPDGSVVAPPGQQSDKNVKLSILNSMAETARLVFWPGFHKQVLLAARAYNYDFDVIQAHPELTDDLELEKFMHGRQWTFAELRRWQTETAPLKSMTSLAAHIDEVFSEILRQGITSGSLSSENYPEMIEVLASMYHEHPDLLPRFASMASAFRHLPESLAFADALLKPQSAPTPLHLKFMTALAEERGELNLDPRLRDELWKKYSAEMQSAGTNPVARANSLPRIAKVAWKPEQITSLLQYKSSEASDAETGALDNAILALLPRLRELGNPLDDLMRNVPKWLVSDQSQWRAQDAIYKMTTSPSELLSLLRIKGTQFPSVAVSQLSRFANQVQPEHVREIFQMAQKAQLKSPSDSNRSQLISLIEAYPQVINSTVILGLLSKKFGFSDHEFLKLQGLALTRATSVAEYFQAAKQMVIDPTESDFVAADSLLERHMDKLFSLQPSIADLIKFKRKILHGLFPKSNMDTTIISRTQTLLEFSQVVDDADVDDSAGFKLNNLLRQADALSTSLAPPAISPNDIKAQSSGPSLSKILLKLAKRSLLTRPQRVEILKAAAEKAKTKDDYREVVDFHPSLVWSKRERDLHEKVIIATVKTYASLGATTTELADLKKVLSKGPSTEFFDAALAHYAQYSGKIAEPDANQDSSRLRTFARRLVGRGAGGKSCAQSLRKN